MIQISIFDKASHKATSCNHVSIINTVAISEPSGHSTEKLIMNNVFHCKQSRYSHKSWYTVNHPEFYKEDEIIGDKQLFNAI